MSLDLTEYVANDVQNLKADLGSDRREFLSTHDLPKNISRVSMEVIEANRAFHKEKSAAGRQYLAHQTQLDAWSSLFLGPDPINS